MPHLIIECSSKVYHEIVSQDLMIDVHHEVVASGLFDEANIKVRVRHYEDYLSAGKPGDFIHVIGFIMGGRTTEQKRKLAERILNKLKDFAKGVPAISVDIRDMDPETYQKN